MGWGWVWGGHSLHALELTVRPGITTVSSYLLIRLASLSHVTSGLLAGFRSPRVHANRPTFQNADHFTPPPYQKYLVSSPRLVQIFTLAASSTNGGGLGGGASGLFEDEAADGSGSSGGGGGGGGGGGELVSSTPPDPMTSGGGAQSVSLQVIRQRIDFQLDPLDWTRL